MRSPKIRVVSFFVALCPLLTFAGVESACVNPVYLTFDSGDMGVAPLVASVLQRNQVKATFFASNERTAVGDGALGNYWAPWWKARAVEGHEFASNTYDHVFLRGDVAGVQPRFRIRPTVGAFAGREFTWDATKYCTQLAYANERLNDFTGKKPLPLFRAPGGRTSPRLLQAARACGFAHVGWAATGVLVDTSAHPKGSNDATLKKALRDVRPGDILYAKLGAPALKDTWTSEVLDPVIQGLKGRGLCFSTLRNHPAYKDWIAGNGG